MRTKIGSLLVAFAALAWSAGAQAQVWYACTASGCTLQGALTGLDTGVWDANGLHNIKGLGVNRAAPSQGNADISGQYQINGAQIACGSLSNAAASCSTDATNASNISSGSLPAARLSLGQLTNSLGANVSLNNTANYFDGPSTAQGSTGTWFASGTVTLVDTAGAAAVSCKLWDGTTVVSSAQVNLTAANVDFVVALSGFLATPAGNLRISCKDATSTSGAIVFNGSGNSKDSTLTVFRIN